MLGFKSLCTHLHHRYGDLLFKFFIISVLFICVGIAVVKIFGTEFQCRCGDVCGVGMAQVSE